MINDKIDNWINYILNKQEYYLNNYYQPLILVDTMVFDKKTHYIYISQKFNKYF